MAVTFSAPCCVYIVLGTTPEAYLEVESAVLGNLFLKWVGNWHLLTCSLLITGLQTFMTMRSTEGMTVPFLFSLTMLDGYC